MMSGSIFAINKPEHISIFDESTQLPAMIHVKSVAAIFSEGQERHAIDSPILLGVRVIYKNGKDSFLYIKKEKYAPLLMTFKPEAVGEEIYIDTSDSYPHIKEQLDKQLANTATRLVFLSQIQSIEIVPGERGHLNSIVIEDRQNEILFKKIIKEYSFHQLDSNYYVAVINHNDEDYFEIQLPASKVEKLEKALAKGLNKRLKNGFNIKFDD
jgi:hypothetical protein